MDADTKRTHDFYRPPQDGEGGAVGWARPEFLELLFVHVADAIFLAEPDGRIVDVNPAASAMLGYSREELLGLQPWDFVTSASRDEILSTLRSMTLGIPVSVRPSYRRKAGGLGTMELILTRFGYPGGELIAACCRDVTEGVHIEERLRTLSERQNYEEELRRLNAELVRQTNQMRQVNRDLQLSEQRLRLAIETGRIGLWVWNSTDVTNSGDWSQQLKQIFGLGLDAEVTHEMFLKCVHPEDRERVDQAVMQALAGENRGEYRAEYRVIHPQDGSKHWVTARGQAFFDSEGQANRFIGTVMEITERKQAEEALVRLNHELEQRIEERTADLEVANLALARSEDYLRIAIDTIPGLVWTSLPDGNIEYLNKRWLDYTGLRQEEASGWGWQVAIHPEDLSGLVTYWKSILAAGEQGEYEARLRRFDGEYRWFLFRGVPLYDEHGQVARWYGTNTDIESMRASEHVARGQLEALRHSMLALAQEAEPDKWVEHVLRVIVKQMGGVSVSVWKREGDHLELAVTLEEGNELRILSDNSSEVPRSTIQGKNHPVWNEFLKTGANYVVADLAADPPLVRLIVPDDSPWHPWHNDSFPIPQKTRQAVSARVTAALMVPMVVAGSVAGAILIRFVQERKLRSEELELARALGHQAMMALQIMRLSRQSREAAVIGERNRLARDIHDTLAQGLTGIIVQLEAEEDARLRGLRDEAVKHLERASELARESLQEARRSVHALRPQALTEKNLCAALAELITKMTMGTGLIGQFTVKGQPRPLPADWEENLLRIGQEVLANTLRHAQASQFHARITFESQGLDLKFSDNGNGFQSESKHGGLGLIGMKERTASIGGKCSIESAEGKGTTIRIILPLAEHREM